MGKRVWWIAAGAFAVSFTLAPHAAPRETTAWTGGRWFDGNTFVRRDVYSIGDRLALRKPRTIDRVVDLAGGYVTPAFGETHNHNIPGGDTNANIRTYLDQGIFYVMIQGNQPRARADLAGRINVPGSLDVVFSNGLFTAPGGHPTALVKRNIANGGMTDADLRGGFLHPVASEADVEAAWRDVAAERPDFIKMVLVYSEDRAAGVPPPTGSDRYGLDPVLAPAIVRRAHAGGLRVSAHVESAYDFGVAVRAGADIVAHMPGFWPDPARIAGKGLDIYRIDEGSAKLAGERHVTVITTLGEALRYVSTDKEGAALKEPLLALYRHNLDVLVKNGVRIAIGSDQFRSTSVPEALEIHRAGLMTPAALLRALSSDAAATIFPARGPFGLASGARADFVVLDADPLADFSAIRRIRLRVKDGRELRVPAAPPPSR